MEQDVTHDAMKDAIYVKMVTKAAANRLGFHSYTNYLMKKWNKSVYQMPNFIEEKKKNVVQT